VTCSTSASSVLKRFWPHPEVRSSSDTTPSSLLLLVCLFSEIINSVKKSYASWAFSASISTGGMPCLSLKKLLDLVASTISFAVSSPRVSVNKFSISLSYSSDYLTITSPFEFFGRTLPLASASSFAFLTSCSFSASYFSFKALAFFCFSSLAFATNSVLYTLTTTPSFLADITSSLMFIGAPKSREFPALRKELWNL